MAVVLTNLKLVVPEADVKTPAPRTSAQAPGKKAKAGVLRGLKKISDGTHADLFSGKAAHAAFGQIRRA